MIKPMLKEAIGKALGMDLSLITEYPCSLTEVQNSQIMMYKINGEKKIITSQIETAGNDSIFSELDGLLLTDNLKISPLTHRNRLVLNKYLPYTLPIAFGKETATFGLGDRLGLASPGHIRSIRNSRAKPILAQQSKRELDLTGRTYEEVLDDVCFAVFQEGYQGGFGADGDHLKHAGDIQDALNCGYTMITLDCSDQIGTGIGNLNPAESLALYEKLPTDYRLQIEKMYLDKVYLIGGAPYSFTKSNLILCALIYEKAIEFTGSIYHNVIKTADHPVDFELSIDETESVTTVYGHLFVAMELRRRETEITSIAPRFVGQFQKGIDYIGDRKELDLQLAQHASIADHFGYKLSIHSGSDKFSVFPMIGSHTRGRLHLKTSGTNWLEAVGVIAERNPSLYRRIHQKAMESFYEAKNFYHVTADIGKIAPLDTREDSKLPEYLRDDNSRQLLHITYGFILREQELKKEIYKTLERNEHYYYNRLSSHIGHHLSKLNL